jgi:hypothetical protein
VPNERKSSLLNELKLKFGDLRQLPSSKSLYELCNSQARIYFRYSKLHHGQRAFYGLRNIDLCQLDGHNSFICFFSDDDSPPLFVSFADFENLLRQSGTASDGQVKVQIIRSHGITELYLPRMGRFNVDAYQGVQTLADKLDTARLESVSRLTHSQVQTLLAGIGHAKGHPVYVPANNLETLDWNLVPQFPIVQHLPAALEPIASVASEIDVLWLNQGREPISALFEVEHSTPIYTGLLRFNDVLLSNLAVNRYFIVSNESRRDLFSRQIQRPTFQRSGLTEITSFLDYSNVMDWYRRIG